MRYDQLIDRIAEIIIDTADQHGLNAHEAARQILALPGICFVTDAEGDFVVVGEVTMPKSFDQSTTSDE